MTGQRRLCEVNALPPGVAVGFEPGLLAIRLADCVMIYLNACPHLGVALDWLPGKFMSANGQLLVCAMHGAEFRPDDGLCLRGPCRGERLTAVASEVRDGFVCVPLTAGLQQDREK